MGSIVCLSFKGCHYLFVLLLVLVYLYTPYCRYHDIIFSDNKSTCMKGALDEDQSVVLKPWPVADLPSPIKSISFNVRMCIVDKGMVISLVK